MVVPFRADHCKVSCLDLAQLRVSVLITAPANRNFSGEH